MKISRSLFAVLAVVLMPMGVRGQITSNGVASEPDYRTYASYTSSNNGFGASNNIRSIKAWGDGRFLHLAVPSDLTSNDNLVLFLDFSGYVGLAAGGNLGATSDIGLFDNLGSSKLDMEVDFAIALNEGGQPDKLFTDMVRYGTTGFLAGGYVGEVNQSGVAVDLPSANITGAMDANGLRVSYLNTGGTNDGIELRLELADFPGIDGTQYVRVFAAIISAGGFWSDELLPTGSYAGGNLGNNANIGALTGDFFTEWIPLAPRTSISTVQGWRFLSSPVSEYTYGTLLSPLWTQGTDGADEPSTAFGANVLVYNHNNGFHKVDFLSGENAWMFTPGAGFMYGHHNDNDNDGTPNSGATSIYVIGEENPTPTDYTPSWTSGTEFALAGNPFATAVDWDSMDKQTGVGGSIWVWDPDSSKYDSWNGSSGTLVDGIIAPFQGFWMYYESALSRIRFATSDKVSGGEFRGKESAGPDRISLSAKHGRYASSMFIEFTEDGLEGSDRGDAIALRPLSKDYVMLTSVSNGIAYDINRQPIPVGRKEIPVDLETTLAEEVELSVSSFQLPEGWEVTLQDRLLGTETALAPGVRIRVPMQASMFKARQEVLDPRPVAVTAATEQRFSLIIDPASSTSVDRGPETVGRMVLEQNYPNPFNPSTQIRFTLRTSNLARLTVYDVLGREVAILVNETLPAGAHSVTFDASTLTSGVYVYKLEAGGEVMTRRMTLIK